MPCRDLRFLVVEDHPVQSRMLVSLLTNMGACAVHTAQDGEAALSVLRDPERPVDIVISDLSMPGMDGMELVRHLSEADSKVSLILTSSLEPQLIASIANMARAYYVTLLGAVGKPMTAVKLAPLIALYLSSANGAQTRHAEVRMLEDVAEAWSRNEFEPCYQPRVDMTTGQIEGMSVLPRWAHPVRGLLEPELFLPSIKTCGLSDDFVWLMVQKSASQCRLWQEAGYALPVSVKVPFDSLTDVNLAERLKQVVQKEGIEPHQMVLCVKEAALNLNLPKALENLARVRVDGFGLAIDDFGNGVMKLERLAKVAFTELQIKSSYVGPMDRNAAARAELALAAEFAYDAGLKIVADGVRSQDEREFLKTWGCGFGQGSFISEPLYKTEVLGWVAKWNASIQEAASTTPGLPIAVAPTAKVARRPGHATR